MLCLFLLFIATILSPCNAFKIEKSKKDSQQVLSGLRTKNPIAFTTASKLGLVRLFFFRERTKRTKRY